MKKGQGALEYLLLIGGAILVAVIVISILIGIAGTGEDETLLAVAHGICAKYSASECPNQVADVKGKSFFCFQQSATDCRATRGTAITACGDPGWIAGGRYYLANNVTQSSAGYCFTINQNNIVLNCDGKTIASTDSGVFLQGTGAGAGNITLKNCQINVTAMGILIGGSLPNTLINNTVCPGGGIQIITDTTHTGSGNICSSCNDASSPSSNICHPVNPTCPTICS